MKVQAEAADRARGTGRAAGALNGLPVGLKDIIDTDDMPTENGTPIDAGRRPSRDATIVRRLRQAGAVIMGKTVTTELASMHPRGTRNPLDADAHARRLVVRLGRRGRRRHGAARDRHADRRVGDPPRLLLRHRRVQADVRPDPAPRRASAGAAARYDRRLRAHRRGCALSSSMRSPGYDPTDPDSLQLPPPRLLEMALTKPPVTPALAFVKTPFWDSAEPATKEGFAELVEALGKGCEEVALPPVFSHATSAIRTIQLVGMARHYRRYREKGAEQLSDYMRGAIEDGLKITAVDYLTALDWQKSLAAGLEPLFDKYDAIVTPAAPGEAPAIDTTGNPIFNALWTLCGVPAVTLPLLEGPNGLPVGVQLVGRRGEDARLLRTARWLARTVQGESSVGMAAA